MSHNLGKYSLIAMAILTSGALIISSTMGNALEMNPSQPVNFSQFNKENLQQTAINLSSGNLHNSQTLKISAPGTTQISGTVTINDQVIQKINSSRTQVDLSSYITKSGKYTVQISGVYSPAHASVSIDYSALSNHISQTTGGNGTMNQVLIINVN